MKIGNTEVPKSAPVDVSDLGGARFPQPNATTFETAKALDGSNSGGVGPIWLSTHSYPWYGRNDDTPDSRQPYTRLTRLRLDEQGNVQSNDAHNVDGYHFDLLDVEGTKVYLASSYPTGLLILDTADIANPTILGASRTIGYASKLVREGDYLYLPMASYGVRRVQAK